MALNYKIWEQDRLFIMTLCPKISTLYLAQLVTCLPHNLRVVSSRLASARNFFYINLFLETVSPHEPYKKTFYFIFLLLLHMFTGVKQILPVHEFHMLFKISLQWLHFSTVRSMLGCQCKGHEFKACHVYRSNILFLHLVCAILTRQWFVKKPFHLNSIQ